MLCRLQLRQHSFMKHRGKSPVCLDTTTGKVCGDNPTTQSCSSSSTLSTTTPAPLHSSESLFPGADSLVVRPRRPTARKSTSRSAIRVAVFRCGDVFSIRQCHAVDDASPATSDTSTEASIDSGISQSESVEQILQILPLLCCHVCNFTSRSMTLFADHLRSSHPVSLRIEILAVDDPVSPRRCGFCPSYQTFSDDEFADHFYTIHRMSRPLICSICQDFASFEVSRLHRHFADHHPSCSPDYGSLSLPYSTCVDQQSSVSGDLIPRDASYTLNPVVSMVDIADMTQVQFRDLLDQSSVWFDYW